MARPTGSTNKGFFCRLRRDLEDIKHMTQNKNLSKTDLMNSMVSLKKKVDKAIRLVDPSKTQDVARLANSVGQIAKGLKVVEELSIKGAEDIHARLTPDEIIRITPDSSLS